jgi:hypothetical protein
MIGSILEPIDKIQPVDFDPRNWRSRVTRDSLRGVLTKFCLDLLENSFLSWTKFDIMLFLKENKHLYVGDYTEWNVRQLAGIVQEEKLQFFIRAKKAKQTIYKNGTPLVEFPSEPFNPEDWVEGFASERLKEYVRLYAEIFEHKWNFLIVMDLVDSLDKAGFTKNSIRDCHFKQVVRIINKEHDS